MSKYKVIDVEFTNKMSLVFAIGHVLGHENLYIWDAKPENSLHLYGYHNDIRPEMASIVIDRKGVNRFSGGYSNDIGFSVSENGRIQAIVSEYDSGNAGAIELMMKIKQAYALEEVRRQAKLRGYSVNETSDGSSIRVVLTRR